MSVFMRLTFGNGDKSDAVQIESFNFGMVSSEVIGGEGGGRSGKVTFHEITVTKHTDTSSPLLLRACEEGGLLPAVQIVFLQPRTETPYLTYDLQHVLVSSIQWSSGGDRPTESIALAFEEFKVTYANDRSGGVTTETVQTSGRFFYPTT